MKFSTILRKIKKLWFLGLPVIFLFCLHSNSLVKLLFQDKLWVHKVNSIKKLEQVQDHYTGIELDVVFKSDSSVFDIYHPPEKSNQLYLKDFFPKSNPKLLYWLDFKNLTKENALASSSYLEKLAKQYAISTDRIIVESPQVAQLIHFEKKGFKTSYYLPTDLKQLDNKTLNIKIQEIKNLIEIHTPDMISSDAKDYSILARYFPNQTKNLWMLATLNDLKSTKQRISIYRRLVDHSVNVLLIRSDE